MYKSANIIFGKLKKKYDENYVISYYDFYEKILNNFEYKKNSIFFFLKNFFLILLSLISIVKIYLLKNIISANYFIINNRNGDYIDKRCKSYLYKKKISSSVNFVRSENFLESIIVYIKFKNIIFINSFK